MVDESGRQWTDSAQHQASGKFANHGLFSPDGTKIVYASHTPWTPQGMGSSEIHLMNADGSNDQVLVSPGPAQRRVGRRTHLVRRWDIRVLRA